MAQNEANTTQSSIVLTPTVGASFRDGWQKIWRYFLKLLLIGIIGGAITIPAGIGSGEVITAAADLGMLGVGIILVVLGIIYSILIVYPVEFGIAFAYLRAARSDKLEVKDMFEAFHNYWNAVLAGLLVGVIVIVGLFLLIIPGIIFGCKLAFVPYLIVDQKMAVIEAVKESWRMTNGHAWKVFFIGLLGLPISIAGLIIFVVGSIPATMWISATYASLYHAISVSNES